jgi:putative LysE/RhtB family amino acid efflux pump
MTKIGGEGGRMRSLAIGFGLGFLVALPLGPMSLFLVRSTLRGGLPAGLGVGVGIATVDGLYAAAGAAGATAVLQISSVQTALGLVGAVVIAWLGVRSLRAALHATTFGEDAASAGWPAFRTSLAATAANPLTILSWAAIFSAVPSDTEPVLLVLGVFVGSLTWVTALALGVSLVRRAVSVRGVQLADGVAGLGLLGFAVALAWRTLS